MTVHKSKTEKDFVLSQYELSLNVWMLPCYPHAVITGIPLEICIIRRSSKSKEVGKEARSFSTDLFKVYFSYS